jgi:phage gp36-like protein
MAYCTQADVQISVGGAIKLAQLSDLDNLLAGAVNSAAVAAAIDEASAEMASYIGHRISINAIAASVPRVVVNKAAAWAARILRRNAYNGQPLADDLDREKMDREWLMHIADGTISLGVEPAPRDAPEITDKAAPRDSTLNISRARLRGYA